MCGNCGKDSDIRLMPWSIMTNDYYCSRDCKDIAEFKHLELEKHSAIASAGNHLWLVK